MKYLAVLGRQPEISIAELEMLTGIGWHQVSSSGRVATARRHGGGALNLALPRSESPEENTLMPSTSDQYHEDSVSDSWRRGVRSLARRGLAPATRGDGLAGCAPERESDIEAGLNIGRLGGVIKLAVELEVRPIEYLQDLPEGKITIGVSDYSHKASRKTAQAEALKLKKILVRHGRSVRVVANKEAVLSTATSLHNGLSGKNPRKVELIKLDTEWYRVIGVQDIDAYAKRDQARPARDAYVGMLPPKLAQILINLCGPLPAGSTILDPFCGTGVVLQEALLMGYRAYGTDISEKMVKYSKKNLEWLNKSANIHSRGASGQPVATGDRRYSSPCQAPDPLESNICQIYLSTLNYIIEQGDATSYQWKQPIDAVACEGYLGKPMSQIPSEMKLKEQKQECGAIIAGFLKNLAGQITPDTPVVVAAPAWLRDSGEYERLDILDYIEDMGYNVNNKSRERLFYHREGQIVARDILILRKK